MLTVWHLTHEPDDDLIGLPHPFHVGKISSLATA